MIRSLGWSVKNYNKFLCPYNLTTFVSKRFEFTEIQNKAINVDDSKFNQLKKYREAEVHLWHSLGRKCINPAEMTEEEWQHLYGLEVKHQRKRYCRYLLVRNEARAEKKHSKEVEKESKKGNRERIVAERHSNQHIVYGLGHNSPLLRVTSQTVNKWINSKLHQAKLHGQKVIIDCSYEKYMTDLERGRVATGLRRVYSENRRHVKPFDLHICGIQLESSIFKNLSGQVPSLLRKSSPTGVHSECFTELFPKERLVMLTPDSDNVLEYSFDDIYVVGGIVDFGRNDPLTLAKAKKLGIRSARLPLDNLRMREGDSRELPMSSAISVIRERQVNNNWNEIIRKCVYLKSNFK